MAFDSKNTKAAAILFSSLFLYNPVSSSVNTDINNSKEGSNTLYYSSPTYTKVNGRDALVQDFDPSKTSLDVKVSQNYEKFSSFIKNAEDEYKDKLKFVTNSTFYDSKNEDFVGDIVFDGEVIESKNYGHIGVSLTYSKDKKINFFHPSEIENKEDYDKIIGGLVNLVEDGVAKEDFSHRNIDAFDGQVRKRGAIGVRKDGSGVLAYSTCSFKDLAKLMKDLNCVDAAGLDSGGERFYYDGTSNRLLLKPSKGNITTSLVAYDLD